MSQFQAVHCCLFDREQDTNIQNEARWHFTRLTNEGVVQAHFERQVSIYSIC